MKVKSSLLGVIAAFVWTLSFVPVSYASAVLPASSGIKTQFYNIEWCSPHYARLQSHWSSVCRLGYLQNIGWVAKVAYDGQDFPSGNIPANTNLPSSLTSTDQSLSSVAALVNFFGNATGGAFALEGEGVLTIRAYITDYADNTSFYKLTYKIDKTAPQISFSNISENTDYTYYGGRVNASMVVTKNDSVSDTSNGDVYGDPIISQYAGDGALPRASHTRPNLHAFYFRNTLSGDGANAGFTINTQYDDTHGTYFANSGDSMLVDGYRGALTSGAQHYRLVAEDGSAPSLNSNKSDLNASFSTADLLNNGDTTGQNSQKRYRLRIYDNTVDPSGSLDSGNYSETAFYAARDNTPPNMGGNGLAGTDTNSAIEKILSFPDNDTVYDRSAYVNGYSPQNSGVSRFLAATRAQSMSYRLADIGVTGNGATNGNGCADYSLCNAGLDTANLRIDIEDADTPASYLTFTTFSNRFDNTGVAQKHFDKVDNNLVSNGTYRKYGVRFQSNNIAGVCDLVGNCIQPKLDFRVVANALSNDASNISLATESSRISGKMIANGSDSYRLSYVLKDAYGNKVVPVKSLENGNIQIKTVDTVTHFRNGLNVDQRSNMPNGTKLVVSVDKESDNESFVSDIDGSGTVSVREKVDGSGPNGIYTMGLLSKVPTKGFYPYLSDNSILQVSSITNSAGVSASADMTYPKTGERLGSFAAASVNTGNSNDFVTPNKGNLGETGGFNNISLTEADYGKIAFNNASNVSFMALGTRRINTEFASPFVYGLTGMRVLIDGQYSQHYKKLYTIDAGVSDYNIYEKNLVAYNTDQDEQPGILNYTVRQSGGGSESLINSGVRYTSTDNFNMFLTGGMPTLQSFDIAHAPASGFSAELQMSSLPGRTYDNSRLRTGIVSALSYRIGSDTILLPSVARNIRDIAGGVLDQFSMSRNYFSSAYSLRSGGAITLASAINNIAVTGLTNKYNSLTTDTGGTKANINVGEELTRFDLVTSIKKNVVLLSAGFAPSSDASARKKWCAGATVDQVFLNVSGGASQECTQTINGETISFIDGNAVLDCGSSNCFVNTKQSVIVKNGSLSIKSNITTLDTAWSQTNGQLFLGVMDDGGLSNVTIDAAHPDIANADKNGWLFIDPSVTNVDAFLFSQGPMVSYSSVDNVFYTKNNTTERKLRNQLHIMGSLLTLNNIAGSRATQVQCPYIIQNCTEDTAQMFDLVYLRRFVLQPLALFTGLPADGNTLVPYHPDGGNIAKKSGGMTGNQTSPASPELRTISDLDYRPYPMLIERDIRWNSNPSALFKIVN